MIIFRPQRGSLKEAMREVQEFESENDLQKHVANWWNSLGTSTVSEADVSFGKESIADYRIGWLDTRYVLLNGCAVGFCATQYSRL